MCPYRQCTTQYSVHCTCPIQLLAYSVAQLCVPLQRLVMLRQGTSRLLDGDAVLPARRADGHVPAAAARTHRKYSKDSYISTHNVQALCQQQAYTASPSDAAAQAHSRGIVRSCTCLLHLDTNSAAVSSIIKPQQLVAV